MPVITFHTNIILCPKLLFLLFPIFAVLKGYAQLPIDFRTEQIYLMTDKKDYNADDTINIEGIVTSLAHEHSAPYSRVLYVELINPRIDSVVVRRKIMCNEKGLFRTTILPDPDADKGDYFLRSYTNLMRNFNPEIFPLRHITVGMHTPPDDGIIYEDIRCTVAPVGRHLIPDIPQQITAVLTSAHGYPLAKQTLALVTSAGDTLDCRETSPAGYAVFNFIPRKNESYALLFSAMGVNKAFQVPATDSHAFRIAGAVSGRKLRFAIEGKAPGKRRIFSFDRNNGLSEISTNATEGVTTLTNAPTGPVTLFLTDGKMNLLAQTSLLPKVDYAFGVMVADTVRADSPIELLPAGTDPDSVTVLSRFISDSQKAAPVAEYELAATDFDSPLSLPLNSFPTPDATADFQAWLGEATFRRFDLAGAVKNDSTVYTYMPEQTMTISGTVYDDENAKHLMKGGRLVAYNGANQMVTDTCVDKNGRFTVDVDFFRDGTEFFLQAINSKGVLIHGVITIDDASYPAIGFLPKVPGSRKLYARSASGAGSIDDDSDSRSLPNVTVKARVIRTEKRNDKKYYGARYLDKEHFEKNNSMTVLDALRRMGFIRVVRVQEESENGKNDEEEGRAKYAYYMIQSTRIPTNITPGAGEIPVIVDGLWMDTKDCQYVFEMPTMQIESIEQMTPAEALFYTSHNINGAIFITTKRLGNGPMKDAKGLRCWPAGLNDMAPAENRVLTAPREPGAYRLIVDMISRDGKVRSISRNIHVVP